MSGCKWITTLMLAGLGGMGAMLLTSRSRNLAGPATKAGSDGRGRQAAWNFPAREELNHIQRAVKVLEQFYGS